MTIDVGDGEVEGLGYQLRLSVGSPTTISEEGGSLDMEIRRTRANYVIDHEVMTKDLGLDLGSCSDENLI
jgi:hypothetical protein